MYERGDRGADQQHRRRRSDDGLPLPGTPGGDGALQMVEGAVAGFEALDSAPQHTAQDDLVQVRTGTVEVVGTTGGATGTRARSCPRAHARYRAEERRQAGEPLRFGGVISPALRFRHSLDGHGVRIRVPVRVHVRRVRRVLRPVVHNSVSSPVDLTLVRMFLRGVLVLAPTHAWASITARSAAIPREPYALTEPREIPSVSATWASVMSAK